MSAHCMVKSRVHTQHRGALTRYGMIWYGMVDSRHCNAMVWYGMLWNGKIKGTYTGVP